MNCTREMGDRIEREKEGGREKGNIISAIETHLTVKVFT